MIYAAPGATIYPDLDNAPTGLTDTMGVRVIRNSDDTTAVARTTAGIREVPADSGHYLATVTAPTEAGEYTILWDTGVVSPSTTASEDLLVTTSIRAALPNEVRPSVQRVATWLRVRPKTVGGDTLLTFTDTTNPTAGQVDQLIDDAMGEVLAQTGATIPDVLVDFVAGTIAVRAAQFVELGYPEVLGTARTSFTELETIYKDRLPWLLEAIQEAQEGDVEAGGGGADAAWGFPAATWGFIESERA